MFSITPQHIFTYNDTTYVESDIYYLFYLAGAPTKWKMAGTIF